jgi:hypothetical protein
VSAILGGLIGLAIGYVSARLYQWWEWRKLPRPAYYAPMGTTPPTMTVTEWTEENA